MTFRSHGNLLHKNASLLCKNGNVLGTDLFNDFERVLFIYIAFRYRNHEADNFSVFWVKR